MNIQLEHTILSQ